MCGLLLLVLCVKLVSVYVSLWKRGGVICQQTFWLSRCTEENAANRQPLSVLHPVNVNVCVCVLAHVCLYGCLMAPQVLYPAICLKNAEMVINFGDTPFKFGPPPGFAGLAQAPADVTVSAAAAATAATAGSDGSERKPLCLVLEPSR